MSENPHQPEMSDNAAKSSDKLTRINP